MRLDREPVGEPATYIWGNPPPLSFEAVSQDLTPVMEEPLGRQMWKCKEDGSTPALEERSGSESVPTHGSMLILVSSFTTQMPKEPSTGSRKHTTKGLKEND